MNVTFRGLTRMTGNLKKMLQESDSKIGKIVKSNTAEMQQKEMRTVPVDTGFLKRSIMISMSDGGLTGRVTPTANYAGYVEYGTRFMDAQPFIKPNFDEQSTKFIAEMKMYWK